MRSTLDIHAPLVDRRPVLGLVIASLLGLANKRFGVLGGVTDLVHGSAEAGGYAAGAYCSSPGSSSAASPTRCSRVPPTPAPLTPGSMPSLSLTAEAAVLFGAGLCDRRRCAHRGGCTSGHGLTGSALAFAGQHRLDDDDHGHRRHDHPAPGRGGLR